MDQLKPNRTPFSCDNRAPDASPARGQAKRSFGERLRRSLDAHEWARHPNFRQVGTCGATAVMKTRAQRELVRKHL